MVHPMQQWLMTTTKYELPSGQAAAVTRSRDRYISAMQRHWFTLSCVHTPHDIVRHRTMSYVVVRSVNTALHLSLRSSDVICDERAWLFENRYRYSHRSTHQSIIHLQLTWRDTDIKTEKKMSLRRVVKVIRKDISMDNNESRVTNTKPRPTSTNDQNFSISWFVKL